MSTPCLADEGLAEGLWCKPHTVEDTGKFTVRLLFSCCYKCVQALLIAFCVTLQILFAALSTCDPGNIFDSIKAAKAAKIR